MYQNEKGVIKKMNEIEIYTKNLLTTIEDVSKFVLFGREKLTSIRAEIRVIDKLQIAEEVRNQKKEEAQLLAEALLDAEVKLEELFQALPKATKGNQYTGKMVSDSSVDNQKDNYKSDSSVDLLKKEVIQNIGFNQKQDERFETLAKKKANELIATMKEKDGIRSWFAYKDKYVNIEKTKSIEDLTVIEESFKKKYTSLNQSKNKIARQKEILSGQMIIEDIKEA